MFAGIPLGISQRGDVIAPALPGANVAFGGVMGQGKSNAARVTMAGAALDPLAELWVFVFANNGDFDAYQPRLSRYHRGVDESTVTAAVDALYALYADVGRREARLAELGAKKVTRQLAERHPDLRPLVALFSECHELFGDPNHGREAADLAVQTMRRARKTAITLMFDTQSSRADAIPPKIVELVKLNACFAVKSWRSNDGFLGDGSFQAGIRATELRMGKDIGTSILTGATAERFEIVKWFYIEADDDTGYDAAADIITRAMTTLHPAITDRQRRRSRRHPSRARPSRRHRHRTRRRPLGRGQGARRRHPGPATGAGPGLGALPDDQRAADPPLPRRARRQGAHHRTPLPRRPRGHPRRHHPTRHRHRPGRRHMRGRRPDPAGAVRPGRTAVSAPPSIVAEARNPGGPAGALHCRCTSLLTSLSQVKALTAAPHSGMKIFTHSGRLHSPTHPVRTTTATPRPAAPCQPPRPPTRTSTTTAGAAAGCRCRRCHHRPNGRTCTAP